jgi:hypothetical protein
MTYNNRVKLAPNTTPILYSYTLFYIDMLKDG